MSAEKELNPSEQQNPALQMPSPVELREAGYLREGIATYILKELSTPQSPFPREDLARLMAEAYPQWGDNAGLYTSMTLSKAREMGFPIVTVTQHTNRNHAADYYDFEAEGGEPIPIPRKNQSGRGRRNIVSRRPKQLEVSHENSDSYNPAPTSIHATRRMQPGEEIRIPSIRREQYIEDQIKDMAPTDKAAASSIFGRRNFDPISARDWLDVINKSRPGNPLHPSDLETVPNALKDWCGMDVKRIEIDGEDYYVHRI